jgi:hypothetical protein
MRKQFDDCFYDNNITVNSRPDKPYITIVAENENETVQVALNSESVKGLIEHLQSIQKNM